MLLLAITPQPDETKKLLLLLLFFLGERIQEIIIGMGRDPMVGAI